MAKGKVLTSAAAASFGIVQAVVEVTDPQRRSRAAESSRATLAAATVSKGK